MKDKKKLSSNIFYNLLALVVVIGSVIFSIYLFTFVAKDFGVRATLYCDDYCKNKTINSTINNTIIITEYINTACEPCPSCDDVQKRYLSCIRSLKAEERLKNNCLLGNNSKYMEELKRFRSYIDNVSSLLK